MAKSAELFSYIEDITKCPICLDDCADPRSLPCLHTFCLDCIQEHCRDKYRGDEAKCPVCRKIFVIPSDGVQSMQHNFFVDDLISVRKASMPACMKKCNQAATTDCESCGDETGNQAAVYCIDCRERLCCMCSTKCRAKKDGAHELVTLGEKPKPETIKRRTSYCTNHEDNAVKIYCSDCQTTACKQCFAVQHRGHAALKIDAVVGDFCAQIDEDVRTLSTTAEVVRQKRRDMEAETQRLFETIGCMEQDIKQKGEDVKRLIDRQVEELLLQLQSVKVREEQEIEECNEQVDILLVSLESFMNYAVELRNNGTPCDISHAAQDLKTRATELKFMPSTINVYKPPIVSFHPSAETDAISPIAGQRKALVGELTSRTVPAERLAELAVECNAIKQLPSVISGIEYDEASVDAPLQWPASPWHAGIEYEASVDAPLWPPHQSYARGSLATSVECNLTTCHRERFAINGHSYWCPRQRACVECGTTCDLGDGTGKHSRCLQCKTVFCFVCLRQLRGFDVAAHDTELCNEAPRQKGPAPIDTRL